MIVEAAAKLDPYGFGGGDLDVVDVQPVPQRLEDAVGEARDHDVADRLLSQEMVDAIDLLLGQAAQDAVVQRLGRSEVGAEGLFDDDATEAALRLLRQARRRQPFDDLAKEPRSHRQIEQDRGFLSAQFRDARADRPIARVVAEVRDLVEQPLAQPRRRRRVERGLAGLVSKLLPEVADLAAKTLVVPGLEVDSQDMEAGRQKSHLGQVV